MSIIKSAYSNEVMATTEGLGTLIWSVGLTDQRVRRAMIADIEGTESVIVDRTDRKGRFAFHPASGKLYFMARGASSTNGAIWRCDPDGSNQEQVYLTDEPADQPMHVDIRGSVVVAHVYTNAFTGVIDGDGDISSMTKSSGWRGSLNDMSIESSSFLWYPRLTFLYRSPLPSFTVGTSWDVTRSRIQVDVNEAYVFLSTNNIVERRSMADPTQVTTIVSGVGMMHPAIFIDRASKSVYHATGAGTDPRHLRQTDYDGNEVRTFAAPDNFAPSHMILI